MSIALFIDANQYLTSLYSSIEGKKLLASLEEQKDHIFISEQITYEVMRRKLGCAQLLFDRILKNIIHSSIPDHLLDIADSEVARFRTMFGQVKEAKSELTTLAVNALAKISKSEDDVSMCLGRLFEKKVTPTDDEFRRARDRREIGNPPGKSTDPLGDQVTWEQLLTHCKAKNIQRLWIISSDTDYITMFGGSSFLNPFLHRELVNVRGSNIEVHCFDKLGDGIKDFATKAGVKADKLVSDAELEKINKEIEALPPRDYILKGEPGSYFLDFNDPWIVNAHLRRRNAAAIMNTEISPVPLPLRDRPEKSS
jgi:hypothetical protein